MITRNILDEVTRAWDITPRRPRPDIAIAGSRERCAFRSVVEDASGRLYILERLSPESIPHRHRIAETLHLLQQRGIPAVQPYLQRQNRGYIADLTHGSWQLVPYVEGIALQRPDYVFDGWRGQALAEFLCALRGSSGEIPGFSPDRPFSLPLFIREFMEKLHRHDPNIYGRVKPVFVILERAFFPAHDELPVSFCHGDYHPLNVIWASRGISAVIDWEFLGYKHELYDAANLIGCIGMELPKGLTGELVISFLRHLFQEEYITPHGKKHLFELVLAQRFAWLSEWLHKSDREMVDLECVYISLLHDNRDTLRRAWGL
jgi:homoserine kinase type II